MELTNVIRSHYYQLGNELEAIPTLLERVMTRTEFPKGWLQNAAKANDRQNERTEAQNATLLVPNRDFWLATREAFGLAQ